MSARPFLHRLRLACAVMSTETPNQESLLGKRLVLQGHFEEPVLIEGVRPLGSGAELRVRLSSGQLEEAVLSEEELNSLLSAGVEQEPGTSVSDPQKIQLLVDSARIRLAYAYDRQFAVSLSGIRTLPHQIEAVYLKMLPQPRLRFLLGG